MESERTGPPDDDRSAGLLAWQRRLYPSGHADRRNLLLHIATVPIFWAGTVQILAAPFTGWSFLFSGAVCLVGAMALQGRGHKLERVPPVPFRGPGDVVARIFAEQWITYPRYVLSGDLGRAWRANSSRA